MKQSPKYLILGLSLILQALARPAYSQRSASDFYDMERFSFKPPQVAERPAPPFSRQTAGSLFINSEPPGGGDETLEVPPDPQEEAPFNADASLSGSTKIHGYAQQETAYRIAPPRALTKLKQILQIGLDHRFNETAKIKLTGRVFYDAVFDLTNHFPEAVRRDQEAEAVFRETYLNFSWGEWDLTFGKQQLVWGEVLGLFFADIVTAKDFREFILPRFEYIRIPQWAVNVQYYREDNTLQLVWIPIPEFDKLPAPGSEFALRPPVPEGIPFVMENEERPARTFSNGEAGIRASTLVSGWNPALFYFHGYDRLPTFFRSVAPGPILKLTPEHTRIDQFGYTLSKDFERFALTSEGVLSLGKRFAVRDLSSETGVVKKNFAEYVVGGSFRLFTQTHVNLQFYQRMILNPPSGLVDRAVDTGASIWVNPKMTDSLNPELFFIYDFRSRDWMFRPKVAWTASDVLLVTLGSDLFGGDERDLFGQFAEKRRIYTELRYTF